MDELEVERRRRRFMQIHGRYLRWGLVGPLRSAGVTFVDEDGFGPYRLFECDAYYIDHGWPGGGPVSDEVRESAETAVIDAAMEHLTKPQLDKIRLPKTGDKFAWEKRGG